MLKQVKLLIFVNYTYMFQPTKYILKTINPYEYIMYINMVYCTYTALLILLTVVFSS